MIAFEDALQLLQNEAQAISRKQELCPLHEAQGRILAAEIRAKVSRPPANVSAMDGYAIRFGDLSKGETGLKCIGEVPAGRPFEPILQPGAAVRIFTGGVLPDGADHILPQEIVTRDGDDIRFEDTSAQPRFVRQAGRDFKQGDVLISAGTRLGAAELALIAAANQDTVSVLKPLNIALLANGNELRAPGSDLAKGELINSNPAGLGPLIRDWGGEVIDLGIAPDNKAAIKEMLTGADQADIIVPIGGASVGAYDYMPAVFDALGFTSIFSKISVRPGKPVWFAKRDTQYVLGLPGNPASAFVCAHLFLRRLIEAQECSLPLIPARLTGELSANGARTAFLRGKAELSQTGDFSVTPHADQDSSLITPFLTANCLIKRDAHARSMRPGDRVSVIMIKPL